MRSPFYAALFFVTALSVAPFIPAPAGPSEAFALDDPALPDGGSIVQVTDGGTDFTVDTAKTSAWNMALRCSPMLTYRMCEQSLARLAVTQDGGNMDPADAATLLYDGGQYQSQGTCVADVNNQLVEGDRTFDIAVPNNRRWFSGHFLGTSASDGGVPVCQLNQVTP